MLRLTIYILGSKIDIPKKERQQVASCMFFVVSFYSNILFWPLFFFVFLCFFFFVFLFLACLCLHHFAYLAYFVYLIVLYFLISLVYSLYHLYFVCLVFLVHYIPSCLAVLSINLIWSDLMLCLFLIC